MEFKLQLEEVLKKLRKPYVVHLLLNLANVRRHYQQLKQPLLLEVAPVLEQQLVAVLNYILISIKNTQIFFYL